MILMIDNYDSFTWNVVQYLWELGAEVDVQRNDAIGLADIEARAPKGICISPGPCSPKEAGISMSVIEHFAGKVPIFGICLGQQSIGAVFGGQIVRAQRVMHGKTSPIHHTGEGVFRSAQSIHCYPLSQPRGRRRLAARLPRGHCLDRGRQRESRGDHGAAPP